MKKLNEKFKDVETELWQVIMKNVVKPGRAFVLGSVVCAGSVLGVSCASTQAQNADATDVKNATAQNALFSFVVPWDDATKTPVDVSFLNHKPAGKNGFIVARNGHFVESKTGKRARFVGAVFTFSSAFPTHAEAEKIAARLAKYGFNAVRMHYFDGNEYGASKSNLWSASHKGSRHFSAEQIDRFDYLVAQLKKHGVYTNINLKVARFFKPEDGFSESVKELPWASKRADYYNRRMIELQKEFARNLLDRVNPYTKTKYANEPAILNLEINNENSLSEGDEAQTVLGFPEPFRGELKTLWNNWLSTRYTSTQALRAAWLAGVGELGNEVLRAPQDEKSWPLEQNAGAKAKISPEGDALRIDIEKAGTLGWHAQVAQAGLTLQNDQTYTLRFEAKSDKARNLPVSASRDQDDWRGVGLGVGAALTTEWKTFEYTFTVRDAIAQHSRITFEMGAQAGTVWLNNISLKPGANLPPLADGALEARKIDLPSTRMGQIRRDWILFLLATETSYVREMRDYLKKDLGVRSLVINTQHNYGVYTAPYRERITDFIDMHAYWDHPQAPVSGWDPVGARFSNKPMTPVLGQNEVLTWAAKYRVANKPFVMSEYNHPAPNEYAVETLPLLASMAARQDWDAIYLHEYGDYGADADTSKIQAYFAVGSDPNKMAFYPAAALIFRTGQIAPAPTRLNAIMPSTQNGGATVNGAWQKHNTSGAILNQRLALAFGAAPADNLKAAEKSSVRLNGDEKTRHFVADSAQAKVLTGYLANQTVACDGATFQFGALAQDFGALTLSAADGKKLSTSGKIVLTALARSQNTDLKWNEDETALTSWGTGPTLADGVTAKIQIKTDGARRVWALSETGAKKTQIAANYAAGTLTFEINPAQKAVWFVIEK